MTPSSRMLELLEKSADAFTRNTNPFDVDWMTQQDVTLIECVDLSELIGKVLTEYVFDQKLKEGGDTS
jgi:hypothetical protein